MARNLPTGCEWIDGKAAKSWLRKKLQIRSTVLALNVFFFLSLALHAGAQDLPVVKDSEPAQYVGKNVEVRGLVVAVYTSKKGNTFLNFGAKYPNQTFTGSSRLGRNWRVTGGPSLFREK
jgi:hypothetical protein